MSPTPTTMAAMMLAVATTALIVSLAMMADAGDTASGSSATRSRSISDSMFNRLCSSDLRERVNQRLEALTPDSSDQVVGPLTHQLYT